MQQGTIIVLFILIFAAASAAVWEAFCHDRARAVRVGFLFFHGIYFALSAVKLYLGSSRNTLPESFWDMESRTYIHYGVPVALICAVGLILLLKVKWFSDSRITDTFCAVMFPGTVLCILARGRSVSL